MSRKLWVNLLLLVVVVVLGLVAWLEPGVKKEEQLKTLTGRGPETVQRLRIEQPGGVIIEFEKRQDRWMMLRPYAMPANQVKLTALARVVEAPILQNFPAAQKERLAQFGLDKPVRLDLDQQTVLFGGIEPISKHRYVQFDDRLMLIVDRFYHHLNAPPEQLLSHNLLPEGSRLKEIETPQYRLYLSDKKWDLKPENPELSGDDITERLRLWQSAQALQLAPVSSVPTGDRVKLTLEDGKEFVFVVLKKDERIWLVRPDLKLGYLLPTQTQLLQPPKPHPPEHAGTAGG